MLIQHITLSTGNSVTHRLDTIDPKAIDTCRLLLPTRGGEVPGFPNWKVNIPGEQMFTIYHQSQPIVTCGIGKGDDPVWHMLWKAQSDFAQAISGLQVKASIPPKRLWLAVLVCPALALVPQQHFSWLADFERTLAAALLIPK